MNEATELQVVEQPYRSHNKKRKSSKVELKNLRAQNYRSKTSDELVNLELCPRSVDDVYSLGVRLQYYIGAIYLELDAMNQGSKQIPYTSLALRQLEGKEEIEKLVNDNLNRLLWYFYNNGGPIIEAPVSEQVAKELQPFFNRIMANFLNQLDVMVNMTFNGDISAIDLDDSINNNIIAMYTVIAKLFKLDEIKNAFNDLISIRKALGNN
ncbi:MAG: hypothetical protein PHZ03_07625 [Syntrophomonas sp.]|nr:hypothetical protein [Syntrophomonas sp.]